MKWILGIIIAGLLIWTAYWFAVARVIETTARNFIDDEQQQGVEIRHQGIGVRGYPYRFGLGIAAPQVFDAARGIGWSAPAFNLQALSYQPNHLILTLPAGQSVTLPGQELSLTGGEVQASLRSRPNLDLTLDRMTAGTEALNISSDAGWSLMLGKGVFATRRAEGDGAQPFAHDIALTLSDIAPDGALRDRIDPEHRLPAVIPSARLDGTLAFDSALDRHYWNAERRRPELTGLTLREVGLLWGDADLRVTADLDFDAAGLADGTLGLRVSGWRAILELSLSLGLLPAEQRRVIETAMSFLERTSLGSRAIEVPLSVRQGVVSLGPLAIGRLPPVARSGLRP